MTFCLFFIFIFFLKTVTPFNFGDKSLTLTPDSAKKCKFDLQASLAKPITWKKHTGKLRPMAFGNVGPQYFKKGLNTSIQTNRYSSLKFVFILYG